MFLTFVCNWQKRDVNIRWTWLALIGTCAPCMGRGVHICMLNYLHRSAGKTPTHGWYHYRMAGFRGRGGDYDIEILALHEM